jgi:cell wall-associated NlpC family hydrolase
LLKKQYLIFSLLFGTTFSLQCQAVNEPIYYNDIKISDFSLDILERYHFNINQIDMETYQEYIVESNIETSLKTITKISSQQIEKLAKSKLGKTYKWGGNGPYAYDCSGFTKEVFELSGINIPRVSKDQAKVGQKISKKNLQKGDLIFFDDKHSSVVSHVGIYLGHGKFIHASKFHKKIVISPLREYRRFFKWGRRLTPHS